MGKSSRNKLSPRELNECRLTARRFFEKQKKFKDIQAKFNEAKAQFNGDMKRFFESEEVDKSIVFSFDELAGESLRVNRIQKSSIEFDAGKLEKAVGKELAKSVVIKQYEIIDIDGLIAYLKECGVEPKVFKSFLNIKRSVDVKELERLEELGKITLEQIDGCYEVKAQNPYFTVAANRGHDDGEGQE